MFKPPRCPWEGCPAHRIEKIELPEDGSDFYVRHGSYKPKCRSHTVPRFRCRVCLRTFSRQTFRADYHDHKPYHNAPLLELLCHGLGLRQSARIIKMTRRCTEIKARKMSRHLRLLGHNFLDQLPEWCSFQLDEMETFETERTVMPLTVPALIEQESMLIIEQVSAPIRPSGGMSDRRRKAIRRRESLEGKRGSGSRRALRRVLSNCARFVKKMPNVRIDSDEKSTYPSLIRQAFGPGVDHRQFSSSAPRDTSNPLFPINHMNAMARYKNGRLRRRSWLASKRSPFLDLQLAAHRAYMNLARPRFNGEAKSPAMVLGLVDQLFAMTDLVSWRQDWGWFSPHPLNGKKTIRQVRARDRELGRAAYQMPPAKRGYAA